MNEDLQPLRIPAGWEIEWNTLFELDPTEEAIAAGFFGGSSLFLATHPRRRFLIEVAWRPEDDPGGRFQLRVVYAPWNRTPEARRRKGGELDFDWAHPIHQSETRSRAELVRELESWLNRCAEWVREGS
jgi:hypothetical protein